MTIKSVTLVAYLAYEVDLDVISDDDQGHLDGACRRSAEDMLNEALLDLNKNATWAHLRLVAVHPFPKFPGGA